MSQLPEIPLHQKLLPEILLRVFNHLDPSSSSLLNCTLCCKRWREVGEEVLYRHIVLDNLNLAQFVNNELIAYPKYPRIHSITIRVGNSPKRYPWAELRTLGHRMYHMKNLRSFSFKRSEPVESPLTFMAILVLISVLDHLPPSCSALEIDDPTARRPPKVGHLCPAIYGNLWKLEYLRVRWPWLCSDLLGPRPAVDEATGSHETKKPLKQLPLCHCVVDTINLFGGSALACRSSKPPHHEPFVPRYAWNKLVERMKEISRTSGPRLEKMMVLSAQSKDTADPLSYSTYVRHDILSNTSKAFPYAPAGDISRNYNCWLIRRSDSMAGDVVGLRWMLFPLAEGSTWQETRGGIRLPAPLMKWYDLEPYLPVLSREEWCANENQKVCQLWKNELRTGTQLLYPGEGALEEQPVVREVPAPPGWIRTEDGDLVEEDSIVESNIPRTGWSTPDESPPEVSRNHSRFMMPVDRSGEVFVE